MMLTALVLLATEPTEVELLSVDQLLIEETRLSHLPSMSTPAVMMVLGLAVAAGGFTVMALNTRDVPGVGGLGGMAQFIGVLGGITGGLGASILVSGLFIVPFRATLRDEGALRLELVRDRLRVTGREPVQHEWVRRAQARILDQARPSAGPAAAFLAGGLVAMVVGAFSLAFVNTPPQLMSAGLAELGVGGILTSVGVWQLVARAREHEVLDEERRELFRRWP